MTDVASAPKQGHEGAPEAWLVLEPGVFDGLQDLRPGDRIIVLICLIAPAATSLAYIRVMMPPSPTGVISTPSADRPNPIGLHPVEVVSLDGLRLRVRSLEAVDGTPIST